MINTLSLLLGIVVASDLPEAFTWRRRGYIAPPGQQGLGHTSWAWAAAAAVESAVAIRGVNESAVRRSVQQLVDCIPGAWCKEAAPPTSSDALAFIVNTSTRSNASLQRGLDLFDSYPYVDAQCYTKHRCQVRTSALGEVKLRGVLRLEAGNETALAEALIAHGPVAAMIDGTNILEYGGGIFSGVNCSTVLEQGVLIVGYTPEAWVLKVRAFSALASHSEYRSNIPHRHLSTLKFYLYSAELWRTLRRIWIYEIEARHERVRDRDGYRSAAARTRIAKSLIIVLRSIVLYRYIIAFI